MDFEDIRKNKSKRYKKIENLGGGGGGTVSIVVGWLIVCFSE